MKTIIHGGLLIIGILFLSACGGGGGSGTDSEPDTPEVKSFSLQLHSADIRLSSSDESLGVDTDQIRRENLTVQ